MTKAEVRAHYEGLLEELQEEEDLRCPDCNEAPCHPQCLSGGGL